MSKRIALLGLDDINEIVEVSKPSSLLEADIGYEVNQVTKDIETYQSNLDVIRQADNDSAVLESVANIVSKQEIKSQVAIEAISLLSNHIAKRNGFSTNNKRKLSTESFIDTVTKFIESILNAIKDTVKKVISWIIGLFTKSKEIDAKLDAKEKKIEKSISTIRVKTKDKSKEPGFVAPVPASLGELVEPLPVKQPVKREGKPAPKEPVKLPNIKARFNLPLARSEGNFDEKKVAGGALLPQHLHMNQVIIRFSKEFSDAMPEHLDFKSKDFADEQQNSRARIFNLCNDVIKEGEIAEELKMFAEISQYGSNDQRHKDWVRFTAKPEIFNAEGEIPCYTLEECVAMKEKVSHMRKSIDLAHRYFETLKKTYEQTEGIPKKVNAYIKKLKYTKVEPEVVNNITSGLKDFNDILATTANWMPVFIGYFLIANRRLNAYFQMIEDSTAEHEKALSA